MTKKAQCWIIIAAAVCLLGLPYLVLAEMPGPDGKALWDYITKTSPYTQWGFWPDHQGMQPGRAPHGPQHKVYVNEAGLTSTQPPAKYGTIEVKENYTKDGKLAAITVQYKIEGYNPADGDWFWAKYGPDGEVQAEGKVNGCIGCHGVRAANDFILVHEFK